MPDEETGVQISGLLERSRLFRVAAAGQPTYTVCIPTLQLSTASRQRTAQQPSSFLRHPISRKIDLSGSLMRLLTQRGNRSTANMQ